MSWAYKFLHRALIKSVSVSSETILRPAISKIGSRVLKGGQVQIKKTFLFEAKLLLYIVSVINKSHQKIVLKKTIFCLTNVQFWYKSQHKCQYVWDESKSIQNTVFFFSFTLKLFGRGEHKHWDQQNPESVLFTVIKRVRKNLKFINTEAGWVFISQLHHE